MLAGCFDRVKETVGKVKEPVFDTGSRSSSSSGFREIASLPSAGASRQASGLRR
jgi:hypothetical protein